MVIPEAMQTTPLKKEDMKMAKLMEMMQKKVMGKDSKEKPKPKQARLGYV